MMRWHDRFVGAWCGIVGFALLYTMGSVIAGWKITQVMSSTELVSMAVLWVAAAGTMALPLLLIAVVLDRRLHRRELA